MLAQIRRRIVDRHLVPRFIRAGWRRSDWSPLNEAYLQARFGYEEEDEIKRAVRIVRDHAWVSFERMATLWQQVRHLDKHDIPGCFVECGVYKGGSVGMMALAHLHTSEPRRELHLFDSFEGLPEPEAAVDGEVAVAFCDQRATGALRSVKKCVGPLEDNQRLLQDIIGYPRKLTKYHVGWFQDTLPQVAPQLGAIALLRLDGDWYESTRLPLLYLYDKVVPGGIVIIDDYGHFEGCRRAVDEFLARQDEPILMHHIDYAARCWVKS